MKIIDQIHYDLVIKSYNESISDQPAIFVSDYASYNEGHICGAWFDLDDYDSKDEFMERIKEFFAELDEVAPLDFNLPREEFMFQDWQSIPEIFIGESYIHESYFEFKELTEDWDIDRKVLLLEYVNHVGLDITNPSSCISDFEEAYSGQYKDDADFAESFADELGYLSESKEWPHSCIDWEWAARELMYDYFEIDGHYFSNL